MQGLLPLISKTGVAVLDGGLSNQLESMGADLSHSTWSARLLRDDPNLIKEAHSAYFKAGAQVAITASYQTSVPSLVDKLGISEEAAEDLIVLSAQLGADARDDSGKSSLDCLVAGSCGPYGACCGDGSEYVFFLQSAFHRPSKTMTSTQTIVLAWPSKMKAPRSC